MLEFCFIYMSIVKSNVGIVVIIFMDLMGCNSSFI